MVIGRWGDTERGRRRDRQATGLEATKVLKTGGATSVRIIV